MFSSKLPPLMSCRIRHALPGRMRIACRGLKYLGAHIADITAALEESVNIKSAKVSIITANVLVGYDAGQASSEEILDQVNAILAAWSLDAYKSEREAKQALTLQERRLQEEPISVMIQRIGATAATLAFAWFWGGFSTCPR